LGGDHQIKRLGRGDQDVRRLADDRLALGLRGVARAEGGADRRQVVAQLLGDFGDLLQRLVEVALDVVGERLQGRDVDDLDAVLKFARLRLADQARNAARVLPEPVGAEMRVSRPARMCGQPSAWASVGALKRRSNQARVIG
jgi:hypothetical protein